MNLAGAKIRVHEQLMEIASLKERLHKLEVERDAAYSQMAKVSYKELGDLVLKCDSALARIYLADGYHERTLVRIRELEAELDAAHAACAVARKTLVITLLFREFSDSWHDMNNSEVVLFREARSAALASNAGQPILDRLKAAEIVCKSGKALEDYLSYAIHAPANAPVWIALGTFRTNLAAYDAVRKEYSMIEDDISSQSEQLLQPK